MQYFAWYLVFRNLVSNSANILTNNNGSFFSLPYHNFQHHIVDTHHMYSILITHIFLLPQVIHIFV
eukprot:UN01067